MSATHVTRRQRLLGSLVALAVAGTAPRLASAAPSVGSAAPSSAVAEEPSPDMQPAASTVEASDEDREEAKRLYADGSSLFQQGRYRAAIAAFDRGYKLSGDANFLFNIALAYDRLDAFDDALEALERFRAATPGADHVELDERARGLRLRRAAAEAKLAESRETLNVASCPEPPPTPVPQPLPPPAQRIMTPGAIVLTAVTGAAVVSAAVLGSISLAQTARAEEQCSSSSGDLRCSSESADALESARRTALGADISIGIAVAAGAGLVAVIVVNVLKRRNKRATPVDVANRQLRFKF